MCLKFPSYAFRIQVGEPEAVGKVKGVTSYVWLISQFLRGSVQHAGSSTGLAKSSSVWFAVPLQPKPWQAKKGLDAIGSLQGLLSEIIHGISPKEFRDSKPSVPSALVIDSKGFFDAVTRSCCSQSISVERRLMIDYGIARETMTNQWILAFWVNNLRMAADVLTQLNGDVRPLFEILEGGTYQIKLCTESGRKETAKKKEEQPEKP